ncbi:hypothetical protein SK128_018718 [Halocaridina rubra]|uniref:Uncharacterized protein n=1 Tax=Halocaridina rubra TaxID=373956 RepID=A0AAN8WVF3_HALRR
MLNILKGCMTFYSDLFLPFLCVHVSVYIHTDVYVLSHTKEQIELCVDVLGQLLPLISAQEVVERFGDQLLRGLSHPVENVRRLSLKRSTSPPIFHPSILRQKQFVSPSFALTYKISEVATSSVGGSVIGQLEDGSRLIQFNLALLITMNHSQERIHCPG